MSYLFWCQLILILLHSWWMPETRVTLWIFSRFPTVTWMRHYIVLHNCLTLGSNLFPGFICRDSLFPLYNYSFNLICHNWHYCIVTATEVPTNTTNKLPDIMKYECKKKHLLSVTGITHDINWFLSSPLWNLITKVNEAAKTWNKIKFTFPTCMPAAEKQQCSPSV